MDKILLSAKDIDNLLAWRDSHKELVRTLPCPLKAVEIIFSHNDYRIKGIREKSILKLSIFDGFTNLGNAEFEIKDHQLYKIKGKLKINEDSFQSVLTVYCSLMALMVYGKYDIPQIEGEIQESVVRKGNTKYKNHTNNRKKSATYILNSSNGTIFIGRKGSHASPNGIFSVRGHWRHYKNGRVIWIAEYKKGDGKKKSKTYKIGGINENI